MKAQRSTDFSCTVNCKLTIYSRDKNKKQKKHFLSSKTRSYIKTYTVYKSYANELGRLSHLQVMSKQGHTLTALHWAAFLVFQSMYLCTMNSLRLSGLQLSPEVDFRDFRLRKGTAGFWPMLLSCGLASSGPRER